MVAKEIVGIKRLNPGDKTVLGRASIEKDNPGKCLLLRNSFFKPYDTIPPHLWSRFLIKLYTKLEQKLLLANPPTFHSSVSQDCVREMEVR